MAKAVNLEKVIDFVAIQEEKKGKMVSCNFGELDALRKIIREAVTKLNPIKASGKGRHPCYDKSTFYIGRGITRLSFFNLYISEFQVNKVIGLLKSAYTHDIYKEGRTIHIYLRGAKRR